MTYRIDLRASFPWLVAAFIFLIFFHVGWAQKENHYWYIDPDGKKVTFIPVDSVIFLNFEVITLDSTKISPKTGLPEKKLAGTPAKRARVLQELRKLGYELQEIGHGSPVKHPSFAFKDSVNFEIIPFFRRTELRSPEQSVASGKTLEDFVQEQNHKLGENIVADVLPALRQDSDGRVFFFRPSTVLIKIRGYIKRDSINHFFERESLEVLTQKWEFPEYYQARLFTCKLPAGRPLFAYLQELSNKPEVEFAIPRKFPGGLSEILPFTKGEGIWKEDQPFIRKLDTDVRDFYRAFVTEDPDIILRRWKIYFPFEERLKPPDGTLITQLPESLRVHIGFSSSYSEFSDYLEELGIRIPNDSTLRQLDLRYHLNDIVLTLSIFQIAKLAEWSGIRGIALPTPVSEY